MVAGIGAVIGLLIAVPPFSSDTKWKTALSSGSVEQIELALTPGYLNPQGSFRYANAAQLFESNKLYDQAYKYAKIGVEFNPDFFDAWKMLYYIQKSTPETADSDNAFVSLFKKCIINLAKHVQMASSFFRSIFCLFCSSFVVQYHSKGLIWNPNGSPFS